nr:hypothetical protein BaRGS_030088 [Batillaria attramentaria]
MVDPNETFQPMEDMILHYIWCGNRFLDFRNYVAMKSALDAIRPRQVYLHYDHLPMKDPHGYFTWFSLLQRQFGNFVMMKVNSTIQPECHASGYKRYILVLDILQRHGGIYMPEDAIFLRIPDRFRFESFVSGITSCSLNFFFEGIVLARKDEFTVPNSEKAKLKTSLFPKDVWNVDDRLANLTKMVAYGKEFSFAQDPSLQMTNDMRRYIMRAEILAHYGGVFHDSHVIWTQQLPDELLEYETVISPDWHAHGNWPESVNHALLIARGGARCIRKTPTRQRHG